jgi:predicted DNA-binding antitoxin AbrB/MazE fold protein
MTVHAIFENGVFKPLGAVNLPDKARVVFDPTVIDPDTDDRTKQDRIFAILRTSLPSGESDVAERHNEHQP